MTHSRSLLRVLACLLAVLLLLPAPAARADFSVEAQAAVAMEVESGIILYQQYADIMIYPASLTKIMTALVAVEHCDLDEMLTVHGEVLEGLHPDSTTANLVDGEQLSLRDLLYCMFLVSANDASLVVAEHVGGTVDQFVQMMNDKATSLGCTGTHFANPHGLHEESHYTTALDLLRMAEAFYQNDTLMDISATEYYSIPATDHNNPHELYTIIYTGSTLITPAYYYEGCRGIKTGSTTAAGRCLVTFCERDDLKVLAVVAGCPRLVSHNGSDWAGHYAAMHNLLDYVYANFDMAVLREVYADEIAARAAAREAAQADPVTPAEPDDTPDTTPEPDDTPEPTVPDPPTEPAETPAEPAQPAEPETPAVVPAEVPAEPSKPEAPAASGGLPWYAWLLLCLAGLLVLYTLAYLIHNFTRPLRRKRRVRPTDEVKK